MADQKDPRPSLFSRLFRRSLISNSTVEPPPYSGAIASEPKIERALIDPEDRFPDIIPLSVPQWTWTNEQCREWLRKFLVAQCGHSMEYAREKAAKLEGFGANLYLRTFLAWKAILGFVDADGIYGLLIGYRNMPGVVPRGVSINHPKSAKEKAELLALTTAKILQDQIKK